jgi:hypothetical protein
VFLLRMTSSLEDEIRRVREHANMLAEEVRILLAHNDERAEQARERARKAQERLETAHKRLEELLSQRDKEGG